jgi:hypothetical protein
MKINYFAENAAISDLDIQYQLAINPMILITGFLIIIAPSIYKKATSDKNKQIT